MERDFTIRKSKQPNKTLQDYAPRSATVSKT